MPRAGSSLRTAWCRTGFPLLEPGEARTALVVVTTIGPPTVEITLRGFVEGVGVHAEAHAVACSDAQVFRLAAADIGQLKRACIFECQASRELVRVDDRFELVRVDHQVGRGRGRTRCDCRSSYRSRVLAFPSEDKSADVSIERISPRTYGGWLRDEHIKPTGFSQEELDTPGVKVSYRLTTVGFDGGTVLPVSVLLNDLEGETLEIVEDPFILDREGDGCDGCSDWLRLDPQKSTVFIAIEVSRPGVDEDPIASDGKRYCPRSGHSRIVLLRSLRVEDCNHLRCVIPSEL